MVGFAALTATLLGFPRCFFSNSSEVNMSNYGRCLLFLMAIMPLPAFSSNFEAIQYVFAAASFAVSAIILTALHFLVRKARSALFRSCVFGSALALVLTPILVESEFSKYYVTPVYAFLVYRAGGLSWHVFIGKMAVLIVSIPVFVVFIYAILHFKNRRRSVDS